VALHAIPPRFCPSNQPIAAHGKAIVPTNRCLRVNETEILPPEEDAARGRLVPRGGIASPARHAPRSSAARAAVPYQ